ncbi:hypothetical protein ACFCVQ_06655 [Bacillus thuringiensis]|uniref:Uncharacterized protein n=1 Tax=Bacillus cereus TaxID=1396 RepID=A0A1T2PWZ6_BACCE|nr:MULTISPECIES: hypothetical protein [Bacillus cereus group]OOZ86411.1 hypothetical protein BHL25_15700 [Bacillus cereus]PHA21275.1 hypothetical protein COE70_12965 [Bacillus cereus]PHG83923.1 hypothetical protein COI69_03870 [Bacillus cereus]SME68431.1 hypothetical protein BACERE00198_00124 [Bacillus cereus]
MINQLREQLWKTIYLNPLYPNDLLDNVKDPDYHGVNFSSHKGGTKVDLVFQDLGQIIKATYFFDSKDYLQKAVIYELNKESILYDRNLEIQSIMNKIKAIAPQEEIFVAI